MILVRKLRKPGQFVAINYGRADVSSTASMTLTLAADISFTAGWYNLSSHKRASVRERIEAAGMMSHGVV